MNSTSNNVTSATIDTIIQEVYENNIYNWLLISSTIPLLYAALLKLPQEIEHIWFKSFSLPTWLYIFARYGTLFRQGCILPTNLVQSVSMGACNGLTIASNSFNILSYIGIQGLLVARAYALCQGHKITAVALASGFLSSLVLQSYVIIDFPGCLSSFSTKAILLSFSGSICVIFIDILIFGVCVWKVWDTWKLKREARMQSRDSPVSVLIKQSILRCCFVVVISMASVTLLGFQFKSSNSVFFVVISQGVISFQNTLSSILVADFTLDLRSLNSANIEASNASLPSLRFSNVLQHVHQSFIVGLATPENMNEEGDGDRDDNIDDNRHGGSIEDIQLAQP